MSTSIATGGPAGGEARSRKYWHYLFVVSTLTILVSVLALLNAYFRFSNITSYNASQAGISSQFLLASYLGMFVSIAILPVPDYILVPIYGYLSSIGIFDPITTFLVCLAGALFPPEYIAGRLAARPLLLKGLSYVDISEKDIEVADKWIEKHGRFSIFISTFIPYFYSVVSLAAGTLKLSLVAFLLYSAAGFGLRFAFLEYIGYKSVYVFAASFDYSQRLLFLLLLIVSSLYAALYLVGALRRPGRVASPR